MEVYKLLVTTYYLGSGVTALGYKKVTRPDGVEIGKTYYDKMGNQQANYVYLDNIEDVDTRFINAFRILKSKYGRKNIPEHAFTFYEESFSRALENHPDAIL